MVLIEGVLTIELIVHCCPEGFCCIFGIVPKRHDRDLYYITKELLMSSGLINQISREESSVPQRMVENLSPLFLVDEFSADFYSNWHNTFVTMTRSVFAWQ